MMKTAACNRRTFIQSAAVASTAVVSPSVWCDQSKSTVVEIHRPGVVDPENRVDPTAVKEMLDRAMREFTGESHLRDGWARFVSKEDVVGVKVNGLGGPQLVSNKSLVKAIIERLIEVGIPENNIIVWDRRSEHIEMMEMGINTGASGVRVYATDHPEIGYVEESSVYDAGTSRLSKIWAEQVTAVINVPIMKHHCIAGTTLAMKNISHGVIHNSNQCHSTGCDPYIAQIIALPEIREKHRLVILDALQGCFDNGPRYSPNAVYNYDSIYVATDYVALDAIGSQVIDCVRQAKGLPTVAEAGTPTNYIATAAALGLGQNNPSRIDHRTIEG